MTVTYIGVGSNIEPQKHIHMALERLKQQLDVSAISSFYKFPAMGTAEGQADFINGMIKVNTSLTAEQLKFSVLREIEYELGRNKDMPKYSARKMDLDLILFGDEVIADLNIPEPEIKTRPYVYKPLLEIAENIILPGDISPLKSVLRDSVNDEDVFEMTWN